MDNYDKILQTMNIMLTYWMQGNADYVEKAIITGALRCILPGLSNFMVNSVVDRHFSKYYGFTESEVDKILREASVWNTEEDLELNKSQIASWYDGYNIEGLKIYNPLSIMNWLYHTQEGDINIFRDYWIDRGNDEVKRLFKNFTCGVELSELLRTGYLTSENLPTGVNLTKVSNEKRQFFALLLHSGYLTPLHDSKKENTERRIVPPWSIWKQSSYVIPNREVKKFVFDILIENWLEHLGNKIPNLALRELVNNLNENLEKSEIYTSIIKNEILNYFENNDHYEIDFQILIEWHSLITGISHAEEPRHTLWNGAINKEKQNSEAIYLPIRDKSTCIVVHEYKKLYSTTTYMVEKTTFDTLIQIYEKGYMDYALYMYETNSYCSYYTHIVVRAMVFYKMGGYPNWNLKVMFRVHRIRDAIEIRNYKMKLKNCKNEADLDKLLEGIVGPIDEEEKQIEQEMGLVEINLKRKPLIDTDMKTKKLKPESIKGIEK